MAPLFGPMSLSGLGGPSTYGYPAGYASGLPGMSAGPYSPVLPAPAVRMAGPSPAVPYPVGVVGTQTTHMDRLFGPFASLQGGVPRPAL